MLDPVTEVEEKTRAFEDCKKDPRSEWNLGYKHEVANDAQARDKGHPRARKCVHRLIYLGKS